MEKLERKLNKQTDLKVELTVLSRPSVISMTKKRMEKKTEPYIVEIASGYTTKTRPGPKEKEEKLDKL